MPQNRTKNFIFFRSLRYISETIGPQKFHFEIRQKISQIQCVENFAVLFCRLYLRHILLFGIYKRWMRYQKIQGKYIFRKHTNK